MPLLGGLLTTLFGGFVGWLAQWFTRKVAFGLATVATMSGLTLALYVLMRATLGTLASSMTGAPGMFMQGLQMVIPPTAPACISSYISIWTACTVYTWQKDLLHLFAKAN